MLESIGIKSFYFLNIAGSAQKKKKKKNRVGRISGNAGRPIFLGLSIMFVRAGLFVLLLNQSYENNSGLPS